MVSMTTVALIAKYSQQSTGLSRYEDSLYQGLCQTQRAEVTVVRPFPFPRKLSRLVTWTGFDPARFFDSYPLRVSREPVEIYHIMSQSLATLLVFQKIHPVVVTVHDIIPYMVRSDPQLNSLRHPVDAWFYRLALSGLRRADAVIAISDYTKNTLVDALGLAPERIEVVCRVVEHDRFYPTEVPEAFRSKYRLPAGQRYVVYVGSEDPRKNVPTLIRAFARLVEEHDDVVLLKVGAPHFEAERAKLKQLVAQLGIEDKVVFLDHVPDQDLALFYNVADVTVMPSLYEGFGLPALESMACGTPVVAANAASLPEVVGDAGLLVDPHDVEGFAQNLHRVLSDSDLRDHLSQLSIERAQQFSVAEQANRTLSVYAALGARQ